MLYIRMLLYVLHVNYIGIYAYYMHDIYIYIYISKKGIDIAKRQIYIYIYTCT